MMAFKQFLTEATALNRGKFKMHPDRFQSFIKKIKKGEAFELLNGKKAFIDASILDTLIDDNPDSIPKNIQTDQGLLALGKFKKTSEFGGQGATKIAAAEWEKIICVAYNMLAHDVSKKDAIKLAQIDLWKSAYDGSIDVGLEIVRNSKLALSSTMIHFGSGSSQLTKEWNQYFIDLTGKSAPGPTKTPKTDMYIKNREKLSLKKVGGSQLMSGGQAESMATLAFAYDALPNKEKTKTVQKIFNVLITNVEEDFIKIKGDKTITQIKRDIKSGATDEITKLVAHQIEKNHQMTRDLGSLFNTTSFKATIIKEAMTGDNKFSDNLSASTHVMVFSEKGASSIHKINDKLVNSYVKKTKMDISFKSAGASSWVSMKGVVSEAANLIDDLLNESINETEAEMINEGILDSIKGGMKAVRRFVSMMFKKFWNKLVVAVTQSMDTLMGVFSVQPTISMTNEVKFPL
jgi:hypothetical protein|tara:strand:+ start:2713 stop:4095 length:1383 start_codon:yes stop_codon:yes gene_type:complete